MRILFIAPLPPPLGGHSLVAKVLYDGLIKKHDVEVVNFNKNSFVEGVSSIKRVFEIFSILKKVRKTQKNADVIYLTISESFAGNLKDIFIYLLCYKKLPVFYIHLHGGSIKRLLWEKSPLIHKINKWLIKKMAGVIISGESHMGIFSDFIETNKIFKVPNFALDYLFVNENFIHNKFQDVSIIRILYMSNMIEKKGYLELAKAYISLTAQEKNKIQINFAGRFEFDSQKNEFLQLISDFPNMQYYGIVDDEKKRNLFSNAHVFALPTSFFEGQPVSILEAYASGCAVITTGQSGILDIFTNKINGFQFYDHSAESIKQTLEDLINNISDLKKIAVNNFNTANQKYRVSIYNKSLLDILEHNFTNITTQS
jgi:glycosyltransferase involved in cell wall biosynthesis